MSFLAPSTTLKNGEYTLESTIGRGGFGCTYRALDNQTGKQVAIKECFPSGCERQENIVVAGDFASHECLEKFRQLFREQRTRLAKLRHRSIVSLVDYFDENCTCYLVMELLEGPTLLEQIEQQGPLPLEAALQIVQELASALQIIHDAGFLHLDIKPENVIMMRGAPVLVDFDLMSARDSKDFSTQPLQLAMQIGTPGYAPLEHYASQAPISPATDLYALGATFYHIITGVAPLSAVDRAAGVELSSPANLRSEVLPHYNYAIETSMQLQSERRPQSVADFLGLLQTPVIPPDEDEDKPQFAAHAKGFYRISLSQKSPTFPKRCVCCYGKQPKDTWLLNSPSGKHILPLCDMCARHQKAARLSGQVTFWGMGASLLLAFFGVYLSVINKSFLPIFFCLLSIFLCFGAVSYGALKSSRADELLSDYCGDPAEPAVYIFNGRTHIWKFRNSNYAEDFKKANEVFIV
jgi:serine/threonine protein kinase